MPKERFHTDEVVPLKLTKPQRKALMHGTRLKAAIKRKLDDADGAQVVLLTRKELDHLNEEAGTAAMFVPDIAWLSKNSRSPPGSPTT